MHNESQATCLCSSEWAFNDTFTQVLIWTTSLYIFFPLWTVLSSMQPFECLHYLYYLLSMKCNSCYWSVCCLLLEVFVCSLLQTNLLFINPQWQYSTKLKTCMESTRPSGLHAVHMCVLIYMNKSRAGHLQSQGDCIILYCVFVLCVLRNVCCCKHLCVWF